MRRKITAVQYAVALLFLSALAVFGWDKVWLSQVSVRSKHGPMARANAPMTAPEQPVTYLPLNGPLANRDAEISGLAWYGEYLILLPQYPKRLGDNIFALPKADIVSFLAGDRSEPLSPIPIPFDSSAIANSIQGFEGFEAIAFAENQVFLAVEASTPAGMRGYLLSGQLDPNLSQLTVGLEPSVEVLSQSGLDNMSEETLVVVSEDLVVAIHEVYGAQFTTVPVTTAFDFTLSEPAVVMSFPPVDYRITDATALDSQGRFWAVNYFYEGDDFLRPTRDPLLARYGQGPTHRQQATVERLVEFQYTSSGTTLVNRPPIQLQLAANGRNWEGIARLDERGFLLITDKFPETILGFVEMPDAETQ
ncbi:MAG: hypothetical protein AB8B99_13495 [Phormidesmis sp.]